MSVAANNYISMAGFPKFKSATASAIVYLDKQGNAYAVDPAIGAFIVYKNVITPYGASNNAGTAGSTTISEGIQEAINYAGSS